MIMTIKEDDFIMTQVQDGSPMFDLEMLCKVIKKKTKVPEFHMKNCGYGLPFEECINRISMNRVSLKYEESISFDDALRFLKEEFNYIKSKNYGTY